MFSRICNPNCFFNYYQWWLNVRDTPRPPPKYYIPYVNLVDITNCFPEFVIQIVFSIKIMASPNISSLHVFISIFHTARRIDIHMWLMREKPEICAKHLRKFRPSFPFS